MAVMITNKFFLLESESELKEISKVECKEIILDKIKTNEKIHLLKHSILEDIYKWNASSKMRRIGTPVARFMKDLQDIYHEDKKLCNACDILLSVQSKDICGIFGAWVEIFLKFESEVTRINTSKDNGESNSKIIEVNPLSDRKKYGLWATKASNIEQKVEKIPLHKIPLQKIKQLWFLQDSDPYHIHVLYCWIDEYKYHNKKEDLVDIIEILKSFLVNYANFRYDTIQILYTDIYKPYHQLIEEPYNHIKNQTVGNLYRTYDYYKSELVKIKNHEVRRFSIYQILKQKIEIIRGIIVDIEKICVNDYNKKYNRYNKDFKKICGLIHQQLKDNQWTEVANAIYNFKDCDIKILDNFSLKKYLKLSNILRGERLCLIKDLKEGRNFGFDIPKLEENLPSEEEFMYMCYYRDRIHATQVLLEGKCVPFDIEVSKICLLYL